MSRRAPHWAAIDEASFVAGMRLLYWVHRRCGRWPFRAALYPVLLWYVLVRPRARAASLDYLRRVAPLSGAATGVRGVVAHFGAFAEAILDKMLLWGGRFRTDEVQYHGLEAMNARLQAGQGVLLVCSHLGNLELCRVLARQRPDLRLTALVHTRHAQTFNRMLAALDPASQLDLLQVTEMTPATAVLLSERVAQGGFVVIAGDRVPVGPRPRVAVVDFLGAPVALPAGPYLMGALLHCPVYMLFTVRRGPRSEIHFELLREAVTLPRGRRDEAARELAVEYAARLQYHCVRAPLQWFNFYDFWQLPDETRSIR